MSESALSSLIGHTGARHLVNAAFAREYGVYRKPGRRRCGIEAITWPWVWSLLDLPWLTYPRVRLAIDGKPLPTESYVLQRRIFPQDRASDESELLPQAVRRAFERGCTVVIDRVESFLPDWKRATAQLAHELQCHTLTNVYASDGTKTGFDLHADWCDNLVIQLDGAKEWVLYPRLRDLHAPIEKCAAPVTTINLQAGQCLYIPRGTPHRVRPTGRPTIHAGVALVPISTAALVKCIADRLEYRIDKSGDGRLPLGMSDEATASLVRQRVAADVADVISSLDLGAFLRERLDSRPFGRM